jgi:hypothetical protein
MRKNILILTALSISAIGIAGAAPVRFWCFGAGTARDGDRQSAISQAHDQAVDQANSACAGVVVNVARTGATCFGGDDDDPYTCMVTVKALCQIH